MLQAAFLHNFVRNQEARIKRNSRSAAWRRDAHNTKQQAMRTETELQQLVSDLKASGTVHAAFCQEWVEQERQSQLSLHDLKLQCNAEVAQTRQGGKGPTTSELTEQHVRYAQQMDKTVWDLAQETRYACQNLDISSAGFCHCHMLFPKDWMFAHAASCRMSLTVLLLPCPGGG